MAGALALLAAKGGPRHRRAGRVAAILGGITAATAVLGIVRSPVPPALVAVTLSASYQLASGLRTLFRREARPTLLDAALAIGALACAVLVARGQGAATASFSPTIEWSALGFAGVVALYDLGRFLLPDTAWQRAWRLDHGLKMIGFFTAMASAGLGNLLPFAQPWSSVLPSVVGTLGMLHVAFVHPIGRRAFGLAVARSST